MKRTLFGAAAVELGLASPADVRRVLDEQYARRVRGRKVAPVGQIMRQMGLLDAEQLARVLLYLEQSGSPVPDDAVRLAGRLKALLPSDGGVIAFTGLSGGIGTTATACETAAALSLSVRTRMLLLDGNGRRPTLHRRFALPEAPGAAQFFDGAEPIAAAAHDVPQAGLCVMPAGGAVADTLATFVQPGARLRLAELRQAFQYVVIDCAPVLDFPDALLVGQQADGVVLVAATGRSRKDEVQEAHRLAESMGCRVLGTVLTAPAGRRPS